MFKEIITVYVNDKYNAGWPPDLIYSDYNVMIILTFTHNIAASIVRSNELDSEFDLVFGKNNWLYFVNYDNKINDVIFIKNIGNLIQQILTNNILVKKIVSEVRIFKEDSDV